MCPATTHGKLTADQRRRAGIRDSLVRLSVGLENVEDLQADIEQAFLSARLESSMPAATQVVYT
ncbi:PLP-dependent transferase [Cupriavidus oxalaticus]|uniref:PLP-dependent transferase n=1 Tax=Cupriavidus oxalaticus TaxID=96344 RepID=A0ABX7HMC2_9BURK|nr:PLP-dependent transferase [Cupriavidus oxalaticus]QRQ84325.1 PLP-dependent transferase [Cupriavidus oxalaticus]QRQ91588.1 PLP-dependent transferase [Cupriavidus oxalaticus]